MKHIKLTIILLISSILAFSQGMYNNGMRIVITSGANISINGENNPDFINGLIWFS